MMAQGLGYLHVLHGGGGVVAQAQVRDNQQALREARARGCGKRSGLRVQDQGCKIKLYEWWMCTIGYVQHLCAQGDTTHDMRAQTAPAACGAIP